MEPHVLDGHVAAVLDEQPGVVAGAVAEHEDAANGGPPRKPPRQPNPAGLEDRRVVVAPSGPEHPRVSRAGDDAQGLRVELHRARPGALPPFADEHQLALLHDERELAVIDPQVNLFLGGRFDRRLGGQRDVPVNRQVPDGDAVGSLDGERLDPIVEDEGRAVSIDRESREGLDEDRQPLRVVGGGVRLEVLALDRVLRPEVVPSLREREDDGATEAARRLEGTLHGRHGVRAAVRNGAERGDVKAPGGLGPTGRRRQQQQRPEPHPPPGVSPQHAMLLFRHRRSTEPAPRSGWCRSLLADDSPQDLDVGERPVGTVRQRRPRLRHARMSPVVMSRPLHPRDTSAFRTSGVNRRLTAA